MSDKLALLERAGVKIIPAEQKSLDRGQVSFDSVDGWYPIFQYWQQGFVGERIPQRALELIRQYRSWTYACANIRAIAVATVPLRLYYARKSAEKMLFPHKAISNAQQKYLAGDSSLKKYITGADEVVEVMEHPSLDTLYYVNEGWDFFSAIELTSTYIDLCGMAFWALDLDHNGLPRAFTVLPSQYTWPHWTRAGEVYEYVFGFLPNQAVFETDEVIFFRQPSPIHQILGYGAGHAAYGGTMIQSTIEDYTDRFFKNNAVPAGILSPEEEGLDEDQRKRLMEIWNQKYAGTLNAGKVAIAPFKVKFEAMMGNMRMLAALADRKVSKEEIAACYHVPLTKLDLSKPDASAVQGDIAFMRDAILPQCRRVEGRLNRDFISRFDDDLFFAFDNPVPPDRAYNLQKGQAMAQTSGIVYVNEVRKIFDLEADPALDGQLVERAPAAFSAPPAQPRNPEGDQVRIVRASIFTPTSRKAIKASANEERLARRLRALFAEQRKEVLAEASYARIMSADRKLFDLKEQNEWVKRFMKGTRDLLQQDIKAGAAAGAEQIGAQISFDIARPEVQSFLDDYTFRFSHAVNETTYDQVRQVLKQGLGEGQTYKEIADGINGVFDYAERSRSLTIAETEGSRALNAGTVEAWKMSGQVAGYYWDADPAACEFCRALAEQYGPDSEMMKLGEVFAAKGDILAGADGGDMRCDYSDVPHPPLHPRCICALEPVLIGEKMLIRIAFRHWKHVAA